MRRGPISLLSLLVAVLAVGGVALLAEFPEPPEVPYENETYDGTFIFPRIRFQPTEWFPSRDFYWGLDLKWNHDYPWAEQNFTRIVDEITNVVPNTEGSVILSLDDDELFRHPWAYVCEVGFWDPTDEQAARLRSYLLKGGFLIVDDFIDAMGGRAQWRNFEYQMKRVLPEYDLIRLDLTHPIFSTFFRLQDLDFNDPRLPFLEGAVYGVFEDNDPEKRLMVVANYNMDIGDFWEWSDQAFYPIDLTQKGFRLGINYVIYGMTH